MRACLCLCLCVLLSIANEGHALTSELTEALASVENGVPPLGTNSVETRDKAAHALDQLRMQLRATPAGSPGCKRFIATSQDLVAQISSDLNRYPSPDLMETNHLQIGIYSFAELNYLVSSKAEGGYSLLDPSQKTACDFDGSLRTKFSEANARLADFFAAAYGRPGLNQIDRTENKLIIAAQEDERADRRNFWLVAGVGTVASLVLWQYAPFAVGAGIRALWGFTPRFLALPAVLIAAQSSAVIAEGLAFNYATDKATEHAIPKRIALGSWDEHMRLLELFLKSPTRSPDLQLALMSRVHSVTYADLLPMTSNTPLPELNESEEFHALVDRLQMLQLLSGANIEEQLKRIPRFIAEKFNYQLVCDSSWTASMSDVRCLRGMRTLANSLMNRRVASPQEAIAIRIGESWHRIDFEEGVPVVGVIYDAGPTDLEGFVSAQLSDKRYLHHIEMREHIGDLQDQLQETLGKSVEIDESLSDALAEQGLMKLAMIAESQKIILAGPAEVVHVSSRFRPSYEQKLKLNEDIDAAASVREIQAFLTSPPPDPQSFFSDRESLVALEGDLAKEYKIKMLDCSPEKLSARDCVFAFKRINVFFKLYNMNAPKVDLLMIVDPSEIHSLADYYIEPSSGKKILLVANSFRLRQLQRWFEASGWNTL